MADLVILGLLSVLFALVGKAILLWWIDERRVQE